jgi:hypothetical protein
MDFLVNHPDWWDLAACKPLDTDLFFNRFTVGAAVEVCETCPVKDLCLWWCMRSEPIGQRHGVFGGKTPVERDRIEESGIRQEKADALYKIELRKVNYEPLER